MCQVRTREYDFKSFINMNTGLTNSEAAPQRIRYIYAPIGHTLSMWAHIDLAERIWALLRLITWKVVGSIPTPDDAHLSFGTQRCDIYKVHTHTSHGSVRGTYAVKYHAYMHTRYYRYCTLWLWQYGSNTFDRTSMHLLAATRLPSATCDQWLNCTRKTRRYRYYSIGIPVLVPYSTE